MPLSVREHASACQIAGCLRTEFRPSPPPQFSDAISHLTAVQGSLWLAVLVLVLAAGLVIFPAIWSPEGERRKASLAVLDRLMRWR